MHYMIHLNLAVYFILIHGTSHPPQTPYTQTHQSHVAKGVFLFVLGYFCVFVYMCGFESGAPPPPIPEPKITRHLKFDTYISHLYFKYFFFEKMIVRRKKPAVSRGF